MKTFRIFILCLLLLILIFGSATLFIMACIADKDKKEFKIYVSIASFLFISFFALACFVKRQIKKIGDE